MFHQQDEMVSSYLFSFREASYPLFWISEFCLHSYLAPLKCQQNLGLWDILNSPDSSGLAIAKSLMKGSLSHGICFRPH